MIFTEVKLRSTFIVEFEESEDDRGFFARTWCQREFESRGLNPKIVQCNLSFTKQKGTIRGLHYQTEPHAQPKLVTCTSGAIYDVAVDIRPNSPTFKEWFAIELNSSNHRMLYVPEGVAHGFQTLADNSKVFYQMSEFYAPAFEHGLRYDDPAFNIEWPQPVTKVSKKDLNWPMFEPFIAPSES